MAAGLTLEPVGSVDGLNYSRGNRVRLVIYRRSGG